MEYEIKETKQIDDTLITTVEYTIGEEKVIVDIPHYQPQTKEEVLLGIENRAVSEKQKLEKGEGIEAIITQLEIGRKVTIGK